jgi:hypothetical protein
MLDGLINTGSISAIALTAFAIIIAGLGKVVVDLYQVKHKADDAKDASEKAVENTANISNGFAHNMGSKLDRILEQQSEMGTSLRDHLEWHLNQVGKEK